jgi:hypothetical protein
MVVQIDVRRFAMANVPSENKPPLLVDADGAKAFEIAPQFLEMIAGRNPQVLIRGRVVDHLKLAKQSAIQIGWYFLRVYIFDKEITQPIISKAYDHSMAPP